MRADFVDLAELRISHRRLHRLADFGASRAHHGPTGGMSLGWRDLFPAFGVVPNEGRVVKDGKLLTGGGVTVGVDFALTLVAEIAGLEGAQEVQLRPECAPSPLFVAGSPEIARPTLWAPLARSSRNQQLNELRESKRSRAAFAGGKLRFQSIDRVSFTLIY